MIGQFTLKAGNSTVIATSVKTETIIIAKSVNILTILIIIRRITTTITSGNAIIIIIAQVIIKRMTRAGKASR